MRIMKNLSAAALSLAMALLLAACGGIEVTPDPVDDFASKNYRYYTWRTDPLPKNTRSSDPVYVLDPAIRKRVDQILRHKGYVLDDQRAQFNVDYLYAPGLVDGAAPEGASNISHIPSVTPNRRIDGASVDNAIALGGVKETSNILLQFNDIARNEAIWEARMTKIVENANQIDPKTLEDNLKVILERAMKDIPDLNTPS